MSSKGNILVVDDEPHILKLNKDLLEKSGYKVATASNTMGAGYLLKDFDPDLVVLDIMLPGTLSGDQAVDSLRALKPELKIIFYSGIDEARLKELAHQHEADAFISKGTRPTVLLHTIERLLGKKKS